ncbi:hypothetical protein HRH25_23695 [Flavisolibacter sp. BT320]|nr:hypothetical protein [Flavisolibacter longurius]
MLSKVVIFFIVIFTSKATFSQDTEKSYDYPVKRGTSEWYSIKTYDSLRKVCQIPSAIVDKMSTGTLLKSVIDYPLLGDVFVFESFQRGLERLAENFGAFAAILQRTDLDVTLLNEYSNWLDKNLDSASNFRKGEYSVQLSFVELLISYSFQQKKIMSA